MARQQTLVGVLLATCVLWIAPWARAQDSEDNALYVPVVDAGIPDPCVAASNAKWTEGQGEQDGRWEWQTTTPSGGATFVSPGWHGLLCSSPSR